MKKFILSLFVGLSAIFSAQATHLMGGEITVLDIGNNQHVVTLIAYRDTVGIQMTTAANIQFDGPNNQNFMRTVPYDSIISGNLLPMYPYGVEIYLFVDTVTFPSLGLWNISWRNCCRNAAIQNLANPLGDNMLLQTSVILDSVGNSSPFFLVPAAIYLPQNTPWQYNALPFDLDGDSLYWSIDTPLTDVGLYCAGYTDPSSDPTNPFSIDPITGTISWTANMLGNHVASILVDQYRDGNWIGEIRRDMQFIVVSPTGGFPTWSGLSSMPKDSNNHFSFDLAEGQSFSLEMVATHTDTSRPVFIEAYGEIFQMANSNARFTRKKSTSEVKGTLTWTPQTGDLREDPYLVVFRASDRFITDDKSVKLNVTSAVGLTEGAAINTLKMYPNPAGEQLFIDYVSQSSEDLKLTVHSLHGQVILSTQTLEANSGKNVFVLNIGHFAPGAYLVSVTGEDGLVQNQIIVKQ